MRKLTTLLIGALLLSACQDDDPVPPSNGGGGNGGGGNITFNWSNCPVESRPVWMAVQDGEDAEWTVVNGSNGSFSFSLTQQRCGIAYVTQGTGSNLTIQYGPGTAFVSHSVCATSGGSNRTATFTLNGTGLIGSVGYGGSFTAGAFPGAPVTLEHILPGTHDIVAYLPSGLLQVGAADRMFIQRDVNLPNGGSATVDMQDPNSFAPETALLTVTGAQSGQVTAMMSYLTDSDCSLAGTVLWTSTGGSSQTITGVPAALQRASDKYYLVTGATATNSSQTVTVGYHDFGPRTEALPSLPGAPAIAALPGDGRRLQATYAVPADVAASAYVSSQFLYNAGNANVGIGVLDGYVADPTTPFTVEVPDLSALAGWQADWLPPTGATVDWTLKVVGGNGSADVTSLCDAVGRGVRSERSGTF